MNLFRADPELYRLGRTPFVYGPMTPSRYRGPNERSQAQGRRRGIKRSVAVRLAERALSRLFPRTT